MKWKLYGNCGKSEWNAESTEMIKYKFGMKEYTMYGKSLELHILLLVVV